MHKSSQEIYLKSLSYHVHKGQAQGVLKAITIPLITLLAILLLPKVYVAIWLALDARMVRLSSTHVSEHYLGGYTIMVTYLRMLLTKSLHQRYKRSYCLLFQRNN